MDLKLLNILTLTGLNWGSYKLHIQSSSRILDIYNVIRGDPLGTIPKNLQYPKKADNNNSS